MTASLRVRTEAGREWPVLVREFGPGWRAVSTALLGGGLGTCAWWLDAQVDTEYFNPDPVAHARSIAAALGLAPDAGCAMLTAADVRRWAAATDEGVEVAATVGLGLPVHAAVPAEVAALEGARRVGTINVLAVVPAPLSDAALVNAVVTATEAKVQALAEAGVAGNGHLLGRRLRRVPRLRGRPRALRRPALAVGGAAGARRARRRGGRHRRLVRGGTMNG